MYLCIRPYLGSCILYSVLFTLFCFYTFEMKYSRYIEPDLELCTKQIMHTYFIELI